MIFMKYKQKGLFLLTIALLFVLNISFSASAVNLSNMSNEEFVSAEIYYIPWLEEFRSALTLEGVRSAYSIKMIIKDKYTVSRLVQWLRLEQMKPTTDIKRFKNTDPRIVFDLYNADGVRVTYFADPGALFTEDGTLMRPINKTFENKFTLGFEYTE